MMDRLETLATFDRVCGLAREGVRIGLQLLAARPDPTTAQQVERMLDRLAVLSGAGTYENLSTLDIVRQAIGHEVELAHDLEGQQSAAALRRAQRIVDAARRGHRLHLRGVPAPAITRGAFVTPVGADLELMLSRTREPHVRWRDGVLVLLSEAEIARLRGLGHRIDILFLGSRPLFHLSDRLDQTQFEAELARRLDLARASPDAIGDDRERFRLNALFAQDVTLRNLRDRFASEHPSSHPVLLATIGDLRQALQEAVLTTAETQGARELSAAQVANESAFNGEIARLISATEDDNGIQAIFRTVAGIGAETRT